MYERPALPTFAHLVLLFALAVHAGAAPRPRDANADAQGAAVNSETAAKAVRCERMSVEVRRHIGNVKLLEFRVERERVNPPATLMRAWERFNGVPETGATVTSELLAAERNKITLLSTGLVANGCPAVDPATVQAAKELSFGERK